MKRKMHNGATKFQYQKARELRETSTHTESVLWEYLKTKPHGIKFRRQHPYSTYILDFYCHSLKLVIEVDGKIHDLPEIKSNDEIRQKQLEMNGLVVMRFPNELVEKNLEEVINKIDTFILSNTDDKKQ